VSLDVGGWVMRQPVAHCQKCGRPQWTITRSGLCRACVKSGARQLESDAYVRSKLGLGEDAPGELVEMKREQLQLSQMLKHLKGAVRDAMDGEA
jgi:hypothetical protein